MDQRALFILISQKQEGAFNTCVRRLYVHPLGLAQCRGRDLGRRGRGRNCDAALNTAVAPVGGSCVVAQGESIPDVAGTSDDIPVVLVHN